MKGQPRPRVPTGKVWPNLVLVRDSGMKYVEFRVQCEVELTPAEADQFEDYVFNPSSNQASRELARQLVQRKAHDDATPAFRTILDLALLGQPSAKRARRRRGRKESGE